TVGWACGVSGEVVRDTVQRLLVGRPGSIGTGAIPKDAIIETVTARGIADLIGTIKVQHVSGGVSLIGLKSYLAGRETFQGETLDYCWCDEEPPIEIYTEILTRTNVGNGLVWLTLTPLLGVSEVVRRFLHEKSPGKRRSSRWTTSRIFRMKGNRGLSLHIQSTNLRLARKAFRSSARAEFSPSKKPGLL